MRMRTRRRTTSKAAALGWQKEDSCGEEQLFLLKAGCHSSFKGNATHCGNHEQRGCRRHPTEYARALPYYPRHVMVGGGHWPLGYLARAHSHGNWCADWVRYCLRILVATHV